jgi:hypothetical protein
VLVTFVSDKMPDINNLKGGIIYFGSWFQRGQSIMVKSKVEQSSSYHGS